MELKGKRIAILAEDQHDEVGTWYSIFRMREGGAEVTVVGARDKPAYMSRRGLELKADTNAEKVSADNFDGVIIPGGYAPDLLRRSLPVTNFVREMYEKGKIVGAICHASWVLVSAGIIKGRTVACASSIKDDINNAGGTYSEKDVIRDGNIVTVESFRHIDGFSREFIGALTEKSQRVLPAASCP